MQSQNKNKIYLFFSILLLGFCSFNSFCQVKGVLIQSKNSEITYYPILKGFVNMLYGPKTCKVNRGGEFSIDFNMDKPGFAVLELPNKRLNVYLDKGDSIFLAVDEKENKISIKGSNHTGHSYYNNISLKMMDSRELKSRPFANTLFDNVDAFFEASKDFISSFINPLDSLKNIDQVSEAFYSNVVLDIKGTVSYSLINFYNSNVRKKINHDKKSLAGSAGPPEYFYQPIFTPDSFIIFKKKIYQYLDPENEDLANSFMGRIYSTIYYNDLYQESKLQNIHTKDTSLIFLPANEHYFMIMPKNKLLEAAWSSSIYWGMATRKPEINQASYNLFKSYFPNSVFLPFLSSASKVNVSSILPSETEGKFIKMNPLPAQQFEEFISNNFNEKYVFIDLWATWCSPCLQEFMHEEKLNKLLASKGIAMLYISLDEMANKTKWERFISNRRLQGAHVQATPEFVKFLKKNIFQKGDILLPRYLLIDKQGKILNSDLPRPSDFDNLKNALKVVPSL